MAITPLPTAPSRSDAPETFISRADAFIAALSTFATETNAAATAMNNNSTNATSSTSMLIAVASKSFTVEASKSYVVGQTVKIASTASPTNWMLGDVTAYNSSTGAITVNVQYIQGSGTLAAWTVSLAPPAPVTIPSGSVMVFFQAAAPTGWTQVTNQTNKALRVVNTAGGGGGGSVAFTTAFASQAVSGTVGSTTLTTAQIPAHSHAFRNSDKGTGSAFTGGSFFHDSGGVNTGTSTDGGSGGSHNHSFTGTAINLAVQYLDLILASKD